MVSAAMLVMLIVAAEIHRAFRKSSSGISNFVSTLLRVPFDSRFLSSTKGAVNLCPSFCSLE